MLINYSNVNIYQDDRLILKDVNFQVNEGEFIYIIGKVGSGKSSLLKTIYCELDVDKGDAEVAEVLGVSVLSMKRRAVPALRKQMGIIFQDFQLLHDRSVYKNLYFVLKATGWKNKDEINERIETVLKEVGMLDKKNKMPSELSGGEQQRIAIARALLNNPVIIIADEPTGNLDPETATNIVGILKRASEEGTTVIMSTHNINLLNQFPGKVYQCKNEEFRIVNDTKDTNDLNDEKIEIIADPLDFQDEEDTTPQS
ncbi:UNVERIFIED_CONTAM: ATP-binding cassette domain-containing protein [Prevotella sp. 15_C9]